MGLKVGNDLKLYYNAGTDASPTWTEMTMVGDVTVNLGVNPAEVDLRISTWLMNLPSKLTASFDVSMANDIGGTVYDALRAIAFARTATQFASANANIATSGTEYFKAFCFFASFPWGQPTQEMSSHDVTLELAYHEESGSLVEPAWDTVTP
jgi:hypothetical protein